MVKGNVVVKDCGIAAVNVYSVEVGFIDAHGGFRCGEIVNDCPYGSVGACGVFLVSTVEGYCDGEGVIL